MLNRLLFLLSLLTALSAMLESQACTEILLNKNKGLVISGRTLDYNCDIASKICFRKKGTEVSDPGFKFTSLSTKPLTWTAKYNAVLVDAFDEEAFVDALNSEGLSVACLWHQDTQAAASVKAGTHALANVSLVEYIAENARTVDEAKGLIDGLSLFISNYKGEPMTLHWIITERSGKSVVVELKEGRPVYFDQINEIGVMTNQPDYDKQLANLSSHEQARKSNSKEYTLPGDYQSTSRFVKSAFLVSHLPPFSTSEAGMACAAQILHNVESPKGAQRNGSYTQWLVVRDQSNLRYCLYGINNSAPKFVDLQKLDFAQMAAKRIPVESALAGNLADAVALKTNGSSSSASLAEQSSKPNGICKPQAGEN